MKAAHKIATLAGAAIFIIAGVILYDYASGMARQNLVSRYETDQRLLTKALATDIEEFFQNVEDQLGTIALFPNVKNAARSEQCNKDLQTIVEANSELFSNLGRVNADGTFICAVNRSIIGEPATKYGTYFQQVKDDPQHKSAMSALINPTGSGEPVIAVHVATYDDKGNFNGTIGGAVYFSEFEKHLLHDVKVSENSFVVLHDSNGDILYHPDPLIRGKNVLSPEMLNLFDPPETIRAFAKDIKQGPHAGRLQYSVRGQERVAMYEPARVIGRHWTINLAVPVADQVKAGNSRNINALLAAIIAALCVVASACLLLAMLYADKKKGLRPRKRAAK